MNWESIKADWDVQEYIGGPKAWPDVKRALEALERQHGEGLVMDALALEQIERSAFTPEGIRRRIPDILKARAAERAKNVAEYEDWRIKAVPSPAWWHEFKRLHSARRAGSLSWDDYCKQCDALAKKHGVGRIGY